MSALTPFADDRIAAAFAAFPEPARSQLLQIREMIFDVASRTDGPGPIEETLKWGQPTYRTSATKSGTPIRLGVTKAGEAAIFTHCQTTVIADFRALFPDLSYDGNRGLLLSPDADPPLAVLGLFIGSALNYHASKRSARPA